MQKEGLEKLQLKGMEILKELNGKTMDSMVQDGEYERYVSFFKNATLRTIVIKKLEQCTILIFRLS